MKEQSYLHHRLGTINTLVSGGKIMQDFIYNVTLNVRERINFPIRHGVNISRLTMSTTIHSNLPCFN